MGGMVRGEIAWRWHGRWTFIIHFFHEPNPSGNTPSTLLEKSTRGGVQMTLFAHRILSASVHDAHQP